MQTLPFDLQPPGSPEGTNILMSQGALQQVCSGQMSFVFVTYLVCYCYLHLNLQRNCLSDTLQKELTHTDNWSEQSQLHFSAALSQRRATQTKYNEIIA